MFSRDLVKTRQKMNSKVYTPAIHVDGHELRVVEQYKQMGSVCTPSGAMGPEVSWRVERARAAYLAVAGRFFGAAACKKRVAGTLLDTRLHHSSETWPPPLVGHARRLEGVQMRWTRKAVRSHRGGGCRETDAQIRATHANQKDW